MSHYKFSKSAELLLNTDRKLIDRLPTENRGVGNSHVRYVLIIQSNVELAKKNLFNIKFSLKYSFSDICIHYLVRNVIFKLWV